VELRHLEYFVAVAEELSFTRASRRLHVVQSGVSSAIQVLERELGAALFDRDRHRVILTEAGRALLPEARATLAAAQAAAEAVAETSAGLRGTLTIGTMLCTGQIDLPRLLGRFHDEHPGVLVRLRTLPGGSAELSQEVLSGALDLALLSHPGEPPPGLAVRLLAREPLVLICATSHPLAVRSGPAADGAVQVTLSSIAGEPFIDFPAGWGNRAVVDRAFAAAGLDRQVSFEVADFPTAAGLVRNGLGIAFFPASAGAAMNGITTVPVDPALPAWQISVATAASRRPPAAVRAFLAELAATGRPGRARDVHSDALLLAMALTGRGPRILGMMLRDDIRTEHSHEPCVTRLPRAPLPAGRSARARPSWPVHRERLPGAVRRAHAAYPAQRVDLLDPAGRPGAEVVELGGDAGGARR